MTEQPEEYPYGEFDLDEDIEPVENLLKYPETDKQDDVDGLGAPGDAPRTPAQAVKLAKDMSRNRTYVGYGMCLKTVRTYYGVAGGVYDAATSWRMSNHKRHVSNGIDIPWGVPVYWTGGSNGHGHIAISIGGGLCLSTDWKSVGRIDVARIDDITNNWNLHLEGYAWEVNGVIVWRPPAPVGTVKLSNLKFRAKNEDVLKVKKQLVKKGYRGINLKSNKFGLGTKRAYARFQRRLGYSGAYADGIPGRVSLRKLGFVVK